MKKILLGLFFCLMFPFAAHGKCVSGVNYVLKGYFEDSGNNAVVGKTLTDVKFDVFYDDGTSSVGNSATAELGQGWYRYTYASNGKSGVWVVRDSTTVLKNFPGGLLESLCDSQDPAAIVDATWDELKSGHTTAGTFGYYLDAQVSAAGGGSDPWTTALPGAYGAGTAGKIVGDALAAHTPQSGDAFSRLGAPAGASVSADVAAVKGDTAAILVDTGTSGVVVADKTGYSLTQAFPTNFSSLAITVGGAVTAGTVSDKTGYTVSTVQDKTGYALSAAGVDAVWDEARAGHTTAGTFGYYLDAPVSTAGGAGSSDWTTDEKNQFRYRLGVDGTTAAPATNTPNMGTLTANVADKTGFSLSTAGVDAILNDTIEGSYTARQVLCAAASVLFGKASGGATTAITFRNLGDSLNRVSETVDASGNRTAVTLNLTGCQ